MSEEVKNKYEYNRFGSKGQRVGQAVLDIMSKDQPEQTVEETIDGFGPKFVQDLENCIEAGRKKYISPFYVFVLTKKEMWACNIVRNFFIARQTYPHSLDMIKEYPQHMKTLYKINDDKGTLELIWSIPGHSECLSVMKSPQSFDPALIQMILGCYAGNFDVEIAPHKK